MAFKIEASNDDFIDSILEDSIQDFNTFFKITWAFNKPNIYLVADRNMIDRILRKSTPDWWVGWSDGKNIFLLDKKNFENESRHLYSDEEYKILIRHELVHCFCNILFPFFRYPLWLREGLALYLSGQHRYKDTPKIFGIFLDCFDQYKKGLYEESGFAVECLINKYGEHKILALIEEITKACSIEQFDMVFKKIYGFKPSYSSFNKMFLEI